MKKENLNTIKQSGFKIPNAYFDTIEDQIMSQISIKNSCENSGFKIPENYFETIEDKIISKTQQPKVIKLINKKTIITIASIAAMVVLFFNLFNTPITFDSLDTETVETYIIDEIDLNDLNSLIDTEQLSQTDFINYNATSIDNYLDEIEIEDLLDQ